MQFVIDDTKRMRAQLPDADGQTVALLEKAAERVSEAARLLRTVAGREGRAETEATR